MSEKKIILTNMGWVKAQYVDIAEVKRRYKRRLFDDKTCVNCAYFEERFNPIECTDCEAYMGLFQTYREHTGPNGTKWIGLPRGDAAFWHLSGIDLDKFELDDRTIKRPMSKIMREHWDITSELREGQKAVIKTWLAARHSRDYGFGMPYGIIKAPPRTGKSLIALALAHRIQYKTVILANQEDLLDQFIEDLYEHTNIRDLQQFYRRPFFSKTVEPDELKGVDIALCTYQSFLTERGRERLEGFQSWAGLLATDECHRSAAAGFSRVVNSFEAEVKLGLSGTPKRKDGLHYIVKQIIGPVTAETRTETMKPRVTVHRSGVGADYKMWNWTKGMQYLANNKKRHNMILDMIQRDAEAGRWIVVPVIFVKQCRKLVEDLNKRGISAVAFTGGNPRKELLEAARKGKYRVVVGIRSIIGTGVNVPRWDCMYTISPISNEPNYEQETARVRTVMEGKPQPIIRVVLDELGACYGCFRTCWKTLSKFDISDKMLLKVQDILSRNKKAKANPESVPMAKLFDLRPSHRLKPTE